MPAAPQYVAVFGDSLTDNGEIYSAFFQNAFNDYIAFWSLFLGPDPSDDALAALEASATAFANVQTELAYANRLGPERAFSNEFTSAVYADDLGPQTVENFATGGGVINGPRWAFGQAAGYDSSLDGQIGRFLDANGGTAPANSAAILFLGGQDFNIGPLNAYEASGFDLAVLQSEGIARSAAMLDELDSSARDLESLGVSSVFFVTVVDFSFFPKYDEASQAETDTIQNLVSAYNMDLHDLATSLTDEGIHAQVIDLNAVSDAIHEDPTGFGIIDERDNFIKPGRNDFDTDQVAFYDPVHPSEAVQQVWATAQMHVVNGGRIVALTEGDDDVDGTLEAEMILGLQGDDVIYGRGRADLIFLGSGDDFGHGGSGGDLISGGRGNDTVLGRNGDDIVAGGQGDDLIRGNKGNDVLIDDLGEDVLRGDDGDDVFVFYDAVFLGGDQVGDFFGGGAGSDTLYLVLDADGYADFVAGEVNTVLAARGIDLRSIETIEAIDGRANVEAALGHLDWFLRADYAGLIAAPAPDVIA